MNILKTTYFHKLWLQEVEKLSGFHNVAELKILASIKDVQVALFTIPSYHWKKLFCEQLSHLSIMVYKQAFSNIITHDFLPKLEVYYNTKIDHYHVFTPSGFEDTVYFYTVKYFNTPVPGFGKSRLRSTEENALNKISHLVRDYYGRGPERISVAIPDNRFMLVSIKGLFTSFVQEYCKKNRDSYHLMQDMLNDIVTEIIHDFCQTEYAIVPETFIETDIENNRIISLVVLESTQSFL